MFYGTFTGDRYCDCGGSSDVSKPLYNRYHNLRWWLTGRIRKRIVNNYRGIYTLAEGV